MKALLLTKSAHLTAKHQNCTVRKSDSFISPTQQHLATLPDGIVDCNCCGRGVLEMKCPNTVTDKTIKKASQCKDYFFINLRFHA